MQKMALGTAAPKPAALTPKLTMPRDEVLAQIRAREQHGTRALGLVVVGRSLH